MMYDLSVLLFVLVVLLYCWLQIRFSRKNVGIPRYERLPGKARRVRDVLTGEELSRRDYIKRMQYTASHAGWRSVDSPPSHEMECLYVASGFVLKGVYGQRNPPKGRWGFTEDRAMFYTPNVTHWMPLPAPPVAPDGAMPR